MIAYGKKTRENEVLQIRLQKSGFGEWLEPDGADGLYGRGTSLAVEAAQRAYGVPVNGHEPDNILARLAPVKSPTLNPLTRFAIDLAISKILKELPMGGIVEALQGKKVYLMVVLGALVVVANHFGLPVPGVTLDPNNWLNDIWALVLVATGRAAIAKAEVAK